MSCGVCKEVVCACGPRQIIVPQERTVLRKEKYMEPMTVNAVRTRVVEEKVPCTAVYKRVNDDCSPKAECHDAPYKAAGACHMKEMDGCDVWSGMGEWLFPWLFWVLPAIILISGALGSLGANDFTTGPWTLNNPLRYADWGFWTSVVVASLLFGVMWGCLYSWGTTRDREPYLSFLISIPLWLGLAYIIVLYGADMPVEATWVGFAMIASTIGIAALIAGVAAYPEIIVLALPFLMWTIYEVSLAYQEALARAAP